MTISNLICEVLTVTIKELRIQRNMTQDALAEAAGCSRITIARMEAGRTPVTMKILDGLSRALDRPIPEIIQMLKQNESDDVQ